MDKDIGGFLIIRMQYIVEKNITIVIRMINTIVFMCENDYIIAKSQYYTFNL